MRRYLHTLGVFWQVAIAAEMEYRLNFVMAALSSLMILGGSIFTLSLFYSQGGTLGGWPWHESLLIMAAYTMLQGVVSTLLNPNYLRISELVREGTLDFILLKPLDSQFWLSTWKLGIWGFPDIALGAGVAIYAAARLETTPSAMNWLLGLMALGCGVMILYSIGYALATTTIWFTKLFNITIAMTSLIEAGRYPLSAYPLAYRVFFTWVLPVAFMTTVPAQAVLGRPMYGWSPWAWVLTGLGICVVTFAFSRWFWLFALRSYTSASS